MMGQLMMTGQLWMMGQVGHDRPMWFLEEIMEIIIVRISKGEPTACEIWQI